MDEISPMILDRLELLNTNVVPEVKNTFSFEELWAEKDKEQRFLIPELVPDASVAVLIGEDGIGKTQIMTQLCLSIAFKFSTFQTLKLNTQHHRCLIVATEDSRLKFTQAMVKQAMAMNPKLVPKEVGIHFTEGSNFDTLEELVIEIVLHLKKHAMDLVVIDAMSDLFTMVDGDINSNSHARSILSKMQKICNDYQTTIIIIHHAGKSKLAEIHRSGSIFATKESTQGAGAITQKPRTVLALSNDPATIAFDGKSYTNYLHVVKANLMGKNYVSNAIRLNFDGNTLLHTFDGLQNIDEWTAENTGTETRIQKDEATGVEKVIKTVSESGQRMNRKPKEVPREVFDQFMNHAFPTTKEQYGSEEIKNKMSAYFKVGLSYVNGSAGYLRYMIDELKLIVNPEKGVYKSADEIPF